MKIRGIFFIFFMALFTAMYSTNYYVSNNGDDSNSGMTPDRAWATIDKVNNTRFFPGDSILFERGHTFYGGIVVKHSGSVAKPIVYSSFGDGDKPIISAFQILDNWTDLGEGLYSTTTDAKNSLNMVVFNSKNQGRGRFPNKSYNIFDTSSKTSITDSDLNNGINWEGGIVAMKTSRFTLEKRRILEHLNGVINFEPIDYDFKTTNGYFITDHINTLDESGEWFIKDNTFYMFFGTSKPEENKVQVSVIDTFAFIRYKSNITFDGFSIEGYNEQVFTINSSNNINVKNCNINFSGNYVIWGGENWGSTSSGFLLENCLINNTNSCPVVLYNEFSDARIINNYIYNSGMINGMKKKGGKYAGIMTWQTDRLLVDGNVIINTGFNPISFIGDEITISNNFIDTFCVHLDDGAGIYTYSGSKADDNDDFLIENNIVLNGIGSPDGTKDNEKAAFGIYLDDATDFTTVKDNTVANCSYGGVYLHNNQNIVILNNLLVNNGYQLFINHGNGVPSMPIRNITFENNTLISLEKDQKSIFYVTVETDFKQIGNFDNNKYLSLTGKDPEFTVCLNGWGHAVDHSFMTWKLLSGNESGSNNELPPNISNDYVFVYNEQKQDKDIELPFSKMVDTNNTFYNGNLILRSLEAKFLFKIAPQEQMYNFRKGWNYFSANILPENNNLFAVFGSLLSNNMLLKIQDEHGKTLEYSSVYGWINNIGIFSSFKAYKIFVTEDCSFTVKGYQMNYPVKIALKKGWNMVPYPEDNEVDAMLVLSKLIDDGLLLKVQDEEGDAVEMNDQDGSWANNIGDFKKGKGYEIKVSEDAFIQFNGN